MAEADQFLVTDTMNRLAIIYRDINAPGVECPLFSYHEPEDYGSQADLDEKLYGVGVRFTTGHFERRYGLQPDEFTLESTTTKNGQAVGSSPEQSPEHSEGSGCGGTFFSDSAKTLPPGQAALDTLVKGILPKAAKQKWDVRWPAFGAYPKGGILRGYPAFAGRAFGTRPGHGGAARPLGRFDDRRQPAGQGGRR